MKNEVKKVLKLIIAAGALVTSAQAGVPLNGLQGDGGIAFNPLAYPAGTYDKDGVFGENVSKPQVGAWYVNLNDADINWYAGSVAFSIAKRVELSYGYGLIDARNVDRSINTHNLGAKVTLLDENFGDTVWVPAIAVGGVYKYTDTEVTKALGTDDYGFDGYLVATKMITQTPLPILVSGGLLESDEVVNGVLGHGEYDTVGFGNVDVLPLKSVALGVEYKQGVDAGDIKNADYFDYHLAWFVNDQLTLVGAYVDTGDRGDSSELGLGGGLVLSAQYAF